MEKYNDIINLPHHVSKKYDRLSIKQRAAQFSPFAALSGFEDAINETIQNSESKMNLDENEKSIT